MNESSAGNSSPPFVFSRWEVFHPLRRHGSFILLFTLSAALSALILTYVYSEKYEARATILLKPTEVTRLKEHETEALGAPLPQAEYKVVSQTMQDLVQSEPVLRMVVAQLHLDVAESRDYSGPFYVRWYKDLKYYLGDKGSDLWSVLKYGRVIQKNPTDDAVEALRKNVSIDSQDSYVFVLKVRDKHQDRVASVAQALAQTLITMLRTNQQGYAQTRSGELRVRLAKKYKDIAAYEQRIQNLLVSSGTPSVSMEIDKDLSQYADLKTSWLNLQGDISETRATVASYDAKLKGQSSPMPGEQKLQAEDFKRMASDKLAAEVKLDGLLHKSASLQASMQRLQARIQALPRVQVDYDLLDNDKQRAQRDYTQINDSLQEAIIQEQSSSTALLVTGTPVPSNSPVTPVKIYHVGLATILALLLAIGIAFVFGYFDIQFFMSSEERRKEVRPPEAQPVPPLSRPLPSVE